MKQIYHCVFFRNKTEPLPEDVHLGPVLCILEFELIQLSHPLDIHKGSRKKQVFQQHAAKESPKDCGGNSLVSMLPHSYACLAASNY